MTSVAIIGTGYVGLVTGAALASRGHDVVCVDIDEARVAAVNAGVPPLHEAGLDELLAATVGRRLSATTDLPSAVRGADIVMICVGTPFGVDAISLTALQEAARATGAALRGSTDYRVVVVKSTVVPGTTDGVVCPILEAASGQRAGVHFGLAVNPEFLTEGQAVQDFLAPDRIVIGGLDERSIDHVADLYTDFTDVPLVRTRNATAELIKYASNALLATMISFANEIADVAALHPGVDVVEVEEALRLSTYLSHVHADGERVTARIADYLRAGCGFGGSCLPKDARALIAHGRSEGLPMRLLDAALQVNTTRAAAVVRLLDDALGGLAGAEVALLGVAFKVDTDNIRESPAFPIAEALIAAGARVRLHDPVVRTLPPDLRDLAPLEPDLATAVQGVDAIVVVTPWRDYRDLPAIVAALPVAPVVLDGRRAFKAGAFEHYLGVGRGPVGSFVDAGVPAGEP